jgi:transcription-repair coupling factor (superfamily II helicase)
LISGGLEPRGAVQYLPSTYVERVSLTDAREQLLGWLATPGTATADRRCARIGGLAGAAGALMLADAAAALTRPIITIAPDGETAEQLATDLRFLLGEIGEAGPTDRRVHHFPAWDVPAFDQVSPAREVMAARMAGLFHLVQTPGLILVTTPDALLQRVMPRAEAREAWRYLVHRETQHLEDIAAYLADWGYHRVPAVEDVGEFAVRGGLLDVFPGGYAQPLRFELVGDTIEDIRSFDPETQRSAGSREDALLLPVQEYDRSRLVRPATVRAVEDRAADLGLARREARRWADALHMGLPLPGVEFLMPYCYDQLESIAAYIAEDAIFWVVDPVRVDGNARALLEEIDRRAATVAAGSLPAAPPASLYLSLDELSSLWTRATVVEVSGLETPSGIGDEAAREGAGISRDEGVGISRDEGAGISRYDVASRSTKGLAVAPAQRGREPSLAPFAAQVRGWRAHGLDPIVVLSAGAQAERLRGLLAAHDLSLTVSDRSFPDARAASSPAGTRAARDGVIICGELSAGVELPLDGLVLVTEEEIFGERRLARRRQRARVQAFLTSLAELKPDDYVVHLDHGIGLYRGLRHLRVADTEGDYLHLEYAGGDRLYLPVDHINLVERYAGSDGKPPPLNKLGSASWERVKGKARDSILSMARELLEVQAAREIAERVPSSRPDGYFREFEAHFPFEATPDQQTAIDEVLSDMQRPQPMDRLVCGDVGYGKTEVALRAAFLAVMEGSQVAVLVPTTVLAQQHLATFRQRFAAYPVRIEMLSRFRSAKENRAVVGDVAEGRVDIVIGTHRLLQRDVRFRKLGLVVIDEEHRFGVADKERIKRLRTEVDVLTLTATPIPRTLQLSLSGMRNLSVIETPPLDRLAIRTYVARFDEHVVRDAILRELRRDGQVFFVHNRVETIDAMARWVADVVPEARVAVGHGQMRERDLERVMRDFIARETSVLVCSAIIESGLDIPSANTIIVNRADNFGLAQLYQLRGRVGRSHHRAYAYLLIPGEHVISEDARKRLRVLQELDDLGSGFRLAAHDLEIRGAGNLLGKRQSGHIAAIGLELYMRMLEDCVLDLRGAERTLEVEPEIQVGIPAFVPETYVPDVSQRLVLYKRLASIERSEDLGEITAELEDRFGSLPPPVDSLLHVMDLRRHLKALLITRVRRRGDQWLFEFHPETPVEGDTLRAFVESGRSRCRMVSEYQLSFSPRARDMDGMLDESRDLLRQLATVRATKSREDPATQ